MSDQQRGRLQTSNNPRILSRSPIVVLRAPSNGFINVQMQYKRKIVNIVNDIVNQPNTIIEPSFNNKDVPWIQPKKVHPSRFDFGQFRLDDQRLPQNDNSTRNTVQSPTQHQQDLNTRTYSNESTGSDELIEKQLGIQTDEESSANQVGVSSKGVTIDSPQYSYKGRFISTKKQLKCQTNLRPDSSSNRNSVQVSPNKSQCDGSPIQFKEISPSKFDNKKYQMMLDYNSDPNFMFQSQFKGLTQKPATPIRESCPERQFRFGSIGLDDASKPSQLDFIITRPVDPKLQKRAFQNRQIQRPQIKIPQLNNDDMQEHNNLRFNLSAENTPIKLTFEQQIDQIEPQNIRESISCDKFPSQNYLQLSTERPKKSQEQIENRPVDVQPSFHLLQIDLNQRKIDNIQKLIEQSKSRRGTKQFESQEVPYSKPQPQTKERPKAVDKIADSSLKQITLGKQDDRGRRFSIEDSQICSRLNQRRCNTLEKNPQMQQSTQATSRLTRFRKLKFLGKGKFSDVYSVVDQKTGFICALKTMQKSLVNSKQLNQLILSEIKIQSYLRHPNIVRTYGIIDDYKQIGIILEYCEMSLLQYFESRKLSEDEIMYIAFQILKGLSYIHSQGIIHRDLKPENILMVNKYVKIADFGISIYASSSKQYCGTITYMAPEVREQKQYDNKADCYSVGMIIKEMAEHSLGKLNRRTYLFRLIEELTLNNPKQRLTADLAIRMYLTQFEKIRVDNFDINILSD